MDIEKPIYLGIALWGKNYFQTFLKYCLPSLLAKGNLPAFKNRTHKTRFVFATTEEDWDWLQCQPIFLKLKEFTLVEFIPIHLISESEYETLNNALHSCKLYNLTQAHHQLVSRMHTDNAVGSIIFPDSIYSDHALSTAFRHLKPGKKAILFHCSRFANTGLLNTLKQRGYIQEEGPININSNDLTRFALQNCNKEVLGQEWGKAHTSSVVTEIWWPLQNNSGILFHSLSWWYVFIDYSQLKHHNTESLSHNTIDGTYLHDNFSIQDVHLLNEDDDFSMFTFSEDMERTLENPFDFEHLRSPFKTALQITSIQKKINASMYRAIDPFKLKLFKLPVYVKCSLTTHEDQKIEEKAQIIIKKILSQKNTLKKLLNNFLHFYIGIPTLKQRSTYMFFSLKRFEFRMVSHIKRILYNMAKYTWKIIRPIFKFTIVSIILLINGLLEILILLIRRRMQSKDKANEQKPRAQAS